MTRLRSLDGLRGVAALIVAVSHWYFLLPDGALQQGWSQQPFFWLLKPFYIQGWAAVDVFFTLSGFVFFWLYGETIRSRALGGYSFAVLRFSRLYPAHFVTLLIVTLLQAWYLGMAGRYFIFTLNDGPHFLAQLFLVQNWWYRAASSFNGVNWSVSVEALLYLVFFWACRAGLRRGTHMLLLALLGVFLLGPDEHIARGVIGFFMGGFAFTLWQSWKDHPQAARLARVTGWAALSGWALLFALLYRWPSLFAASEGNNQFLIPFDFLLCPLTVLALALREHLGRPVHASFAVLGDISYAVYLLHFPLLLGLALTGAHWGLGPAFWMQGWVLAAFLAALIGLSALTHYRFERPLRDMLRGSLSSRRAAAA